MPSPADEAGPDPVREPWALPAGDVLCALGVELVAGLSEEEAAHRLELDGPNRLREERPRGAGRILVDQLRSLVVALLAAAAVLSFLFGGPGEGAAILVVVVINTLIGFATELRAVRSMDALRALGAVQTRVRRAGRDRILPAEEVVAGDILVLEGGDVVVADARLVQASRLQADESTFTGESAPVAKDAQPVEDGERIDRRSDMLFQGTSLTRGSAEGVVVATGMQTELGRIYTLTEEAESEATPLEKRLDQLARRLMGVTLAIAAMVIVSGLLTGKPLFLMVETGIALAVATIPEGLPIVATIALARGLWRMSRQNALINRISAVETLGATSVICTDKTGTLTENRMRVARVVLDDGAVEVRHPDDVSGGAFARAERDVDTQSEPLLLRALEIGVLCNNAGLGEEPDGADAVGDPLEIALLAAGARAGLRRNALEEGRPRLDEVAFDSASKRMATYQRADSGVDVLVKGAPEAVLAACTHVLGAGGPRALDDAARAAWLARTLALAEEGLRMLAVAARHTASPTEEAYRDLALVGLFALVDPPRLDVPAAIEACRAAGIRVLMLTGDHPATAGAIARSVGLADPAESPVQLGETLVAADRLAPAERDRLRNTVIFARVQPEEKLDLVRLHQEAGEVVGMIGDGVNDAPALKQADIGIAMGRRGTQVAREAADMILTDDAFPSIVAAVREGRGIFRNIRAFVFYLLSCNLSEVLLVGAASAIDAPLPILPLQILFLNLVSDVFPALALGMGEAPPGTLAEPPRPAGEGILTRRDAFGIAGYGATITASVLGLFLLCLGPLELGQERAVTTAFLCLSFAQLWHVFNLRERGTSLFRSEITANRHVWFALATCTLLLLAAVYVSPVARVLALERPAPLEWALLLAGSAVPVLAGQIAHAWTRGRPPR